MIVSFIDNKLSNRKEWSDEDIRTEFKEWIDSKDPAWTDYYYMRLVYFFVMERMGVLDNRDEVQKIEDLVRDLILNRQRVSTDGRKNQAKGS